MSPTVESASASASAPELVCQRARTGPHGSPRPIGGDLATFTPSLLDVGARRRKTRGMAIASPYRGRGPAPPVPIVVTSGPNDTAAMRLLEEACGLGANAIIGMRCDSTAEEECAYGTAVRIPE